MATTSHTPPGAGFIDFYHSNYGRLAAQLTAYLNDADAAEDVVQEAFLRAWQRWAKLSSYDDPVAWLRRVAWNLATSRWRRIIREARFARRHTETAVTEALGPENVALVTALRTLRPDHRRVIVMHYLADVPVADICADLGVPRGTVLSWLQRGRAGLARQLRDDEVSYRDTAHAFRAPTVSTVEHAARRRGERRAVIAMAVATLLIGLAAAVAVGRPPRHDPAPQPEPSVSPSATPGSSPSSSPPPSPSAAPQSKSPVRLTSVPRSAMLQPGDLGSGHREVEYEEGDGSLRALAIFCPDFQGTAYPGPSEPSDSRRVYYTGPAAVEQSASLGSEQYNQWRLDEDRRLVEACASFSTQDYAYTIEVIASGFAGEDSILVELTIKHDGVTDKRYYVHFWQGQFYTEITARDDKRSSSNLQELGRKAAQRFCAAAGGC